MQLLYIIISISNRYNKKSNSQKDLRCWGVIGVLGVRGVWGVMGVRIVRILED